MKKKMIVIAFILLNALINVSYAATLTRPSEIFIIRHADKLDDNPGQVLSAKGQVRAYAFAKYFMDNWADRGHIPDYVFGTDPYGLKSFRQLETLSPLINLLKVKFPEHKVKVTHAFQILHPYINSDYKRLADDLLNKQKFDKKRILICWDHGYIPDMALELGVSNKDMHAALGIPESEPLKWPSTEYDTVYYITYDANGGAHIQVFTNRYPVKDITIEELYAKILS
jgi:hypothetical protein